jgi:hypothetical protein
MLDVSNLFLMKGLAETFKTGSEALEIRKAPFLFLKIYL